MIVKTGMVEGCPQLGQETFTCSGGNRMIESFLLHSLFASELEAFRQMIVNEVGEKGQL